jgi:hypothetical protein
VPDKEAYVDDAALRFGLSRNDLRCSSYASPDDLKERMNVLLYR